MSSFAPPSVLPDISPSRGEIALLSLPSPNTVKEELSTELPISPLEGEMSGRTEGAATERNVDDCHPDPPHELG
ncbi:MAG: hypothetical protein E5Y79_13200 [Mesorhizobium sp.]|nr:MAG: hypothetical protein E5Y85_14360 [Mesorhizobium sp.]TIL53331.1 MAG: hypothetical protein E5Y83_07965 [Mesorhizobium sp.]TIL59687.1 MAG: hypothetical protein E5Y79_13200 [Mesorhizobium sp.]TIL95850.1 MAG: hypothetical protein E5Y73_04920 [Mesorhizobium sp.]TIM12596.1 MAG: hypothetical protein E5Y67_21870 [Mesorhizobium sp.]